MADSVDRVFVHALNTVKKIPRTGSARPPPGDRLRLYGLYKQAMEGDVDGVMDRPGSSGVGRDEGGVETTTSNAEEIIREQEKWDAWDKQKGVGRTEAKKRYIEALIGTMHQYASQTADARELVAELEFVWDQIKNNSPTSSSSSPVRPGPPPYPTARQFSQQSQSRHEPAQQQSGGREGPMRILSPMSQDDASSNLIDDNEDAESTTSLTNKRSRKWRESVEAAMVKMTAEMAALREQIATGREWKTKRRQTAQAWLGWIVYMVLRHLLIDAVFLGLLFLWLRRRRDRRLEDLFRKSVGIWREYARSYLPAR